MTLNILFPKIDKHVDPDFEDQYHACVQLGYNVHLFNYDQFISDKNFFLKPANTLTPLIYRGWMMDVPTYVKFYEYLLTKNFKLVNCSKNYEFVHYFPHIYPYISESTPKIEYISEQYLNSTPIEKLLPELGKIKNSFGSKFILKDYVKSLKIGNAVDVYNKHMSVDELYERIQIFIQKRNTYGNFCGGIVFKEYVPLKRYGDFTNEYRAFIYNKKIITLENNSNLEKSNRPIINLQKYAKTINIPFYTIDVAEKEDGSWTIIETGDGGVSSLATSQHPFVFYNLLLDSLFRVVK